MEPLNKKERLVIRLPMEQKLFFKRAAQLGGYMNLTDFVIASVQERAMIITERKQVLISQRDSEIFFNAIFNPKKPNKKLHSASKEYLSLTGK